MREYITDAIVLHKTPVREFDARVSLFTKDLGKVSAKVTSARKITSKLSQHLEPLARVRVRLIEKGGFQVADVVSRGKFSKHHFQLMRLLNSALTEGYPDRELWSALEGSSLNTRHILSVLGFGAGEAVCYSCGKTPDYFLFRDHMFFCRDCFKEGIPLTDYIALDG